jgi:hypothetical protein
MLKDLSKGEGRMVWYNEDRWLAHAILTTHGYSSLQKRKEGRPKWQTNLTKASTPPTVQPRTKTRVCGTFEQKNDDHLDHNIDYLPF